MLLFAGLPNSTQSPRLPLAARALLMFFVVQFQGSRSLDFYEGHVTEALAHI